MAKIFIGSSSESLNIAEQIKSYFRYNYDCTIWKDHFFELNQSTYDTLTKKSVAYDYAIFVGGVDDSVKRIKDKKKRKAVRDNVYLEFGLYAGVLSRERTFFFVNKKAQIASDLLGIDIIYYRNVNDVIKGCKTIERKIEEEEKINRISLLPSTSLAYNYYCNFLSLLTDSQAIYEIPNSDVKQPTIKSIIIVMPKECNTDWRIWAKEYFMYHNCDDAIVKIKPRNISIKYDKDVFLNNQEMIIYDVPQILTASFWAVDAVMGKDYIGSTGIVSEVKAKEMLNFIKTLTNLINENPSLVAITKLVTIENINNLVFCNGEDNEKA